MDAVSNSRNAVVFGPFRLSPSERLLERNGLPVSIGGRALDILITLAERPGEVCDQKDLMARVWPDVTVDKGSLRFHIAALRKVLGEGDEGIRYVVNIAGRGYSFVAPVARAENFGAVAAPEEPKSSEHNQSLPIQLARMVGRTAPINEVASHLETSRIVTVVGPGGIGKTTIAVAVGHAVLERYNGAVTFVDLSVLSDPQQVAGAVAATLGLVVQSNAVAPSLVAFLRTRSMLLVLDNCEHVIEGVASLAERIFEQAPDVDILATSREAFRIEGEQVYILPPLEAPPDGAKMTAEAVLAYPAAQLFVERIAAGGRPFKIDDAEANVVAQICRKLDGMALAIELAAGRVEAYGIQRTADLLDDRIRLLWHGRRTAPQRQQTLSATFDWSYNLLQDTERRVLNRLSVFVGSFELEAVQAVASDQDIDGTAALEALAGLVAKSLVTSRPVAGEARYHLLQTTRAYVRGKAAAKEEAEALSLLHALYFTEFLERNIGGPGPSSASRSYSFYGEHVGNVRAALEWSLSPVGRRDVAVRLAAAAAALFLELSLLGECESWSRRALQCLDETTRGSQDEMKLQAAHGLSLMFTRGNGDEVRAALSRGLELAQTWNDKYREIQILGALNTLQTRVNDYAGAIATARRCEAVAAEIDVPEAAAMADWMLGACLMLSGDQGAARPYCETALRLPPVSARLNTLHFGYDHRMRALFTLAACLWLQGSFKEAVDVTWQAIEEAEALDHPLTLNIILIYTAPIFIWQRDWENAEELIGRQIADAEKHGFGPYRVVGMALSGEISVRRGKPEVGVPLLQKSLEQLRTERHHILTTVFLCAIADGLAMLGQVQAARAAAAEAVGHVDRDGESYDAPEVLRLHAKYLALGDRPDLPQAEAFLRRAVEMARRQAAAFWEMRAANDLARLLIRNDARDEALGLLREAYGKFHQGFDTPDLTDARELLLALGWQPAAMKADSLK